jgi:hypothetical protein
MTHPMLRHLKPLAIAAMLSSSSAACGSSPLGWLTQDVCVTRLGVTSAVSGNTITTTVTPDQGSACTSSACTFKASASTRVSVTYDTNGGQFAYLDAVEGVLTTVPSITPSVDGTSIDFAVAAASGNDVVFLQDPKITVKTGTCTGDDDR